MSSSKRTVPDRVAAVQQRRRSGGAGAHGKPYNRRASRRAAIKDQEG